MKKYIGPGGEMSNLVERLLAGAFDPGNAISYSAAERATETMKEAAEEIELLRAALAENKRLKMLALESRTVYGGWPDVEKAGK
jgi:hypothetical protein